MVPLTWCTVTHLIVMLSYYIFKISPIDDKFDLCGELASSASDMQRFALSRIYSLTRQFSTSVPRMAPPRLSQSCQSFPVLLPTDRPAASPQIAVIMLLDNVGRRKEDVCRLCSLRDALQPRTRVCMVARRPSHTSRCLSATADLMPPLCVCAPMQTTPCSASRMPRSPSSSTPRSSEWSWVRLSLAIDVGPETVADPLFLHLRTVHKSDGGDFTKWVRGQWADIDARDA